MLAVENIGKFGELILSHQTFTYQSFTVHMILSVFKVWDSVNLTVIVSKLEFFNHDVNCKPISSLLNMTGPLSKTISAKGDLIGGC